MTSDQIGSKKSEPITHIILACDESGSKGYADQDESTHGETGVFAGLMVPATDLAAIGPAFDDVVQRYAA